MKKIVFYSFLVLFLSFAGAVLAHQPVIVYLQNNNINITNPEISRAFYDELKGAPKDYIISSDKDFELYINLLVPDPANRDTRYSADIFDENENKIYSLDGNSVVWQEYYEEFGRDYYLKGPELSQQVVAGKYKIKIYSQDNLGKYVLAVGQKESFDALSILNVYWQLPFLKLTFFKTSVLQFFLTPFAIAGVGLIGCIFILWAFIYYLTGLVKKIIRHNEAKTLLLTSGGMPQMKDEIINLLQKPTYDITVAFITTASKTEENTDYVERDLVIMRDELRFNVEKVDIDGKTEAQVMKLLELKDIIFVEGGNTFYLLKSMRACNFERVIRKLLKLLML